MWIQIILIATMFGITLYLIRSTPSARHLALRRLLLFVALVLSIVIILAPGWLSTIAHALGIGRGTDLLLYGLIVVFLLYAVTEYKRSLQAIRATTALARQLTLIEARLQDTIAQMHEGTDQDEEATSPD